MDYQFVWFPACAVEFGKDSNMPEIAQITGIGPTLAAACTEAGFSRVDDIAGAAPAELAAVPGIGQARAVILISAARSLLNGAEQPEAEDTKPVKAKKSKKKAKARKDKKKQNKQNKQKKNGKKNKKKTGKGKRNSKTKKSKSGKRK